MFGRKTQEIKKLRQRVERVTEQRDWARSEKETSRTVSASIAAKFADNHTFGWDENAKLLDEIAVLRAENVELRRGADRTDLIATTRELTAAKLTIAQHQRELDDWSSIAINQAERHGRLIRAVVRYRAEITTLTKQLGVPDRAVDPAKPTPELVRVTRERDAARALLRPMQDRLDAYQRASEAQDLVATGRPAARLSAVGGRA